MYKLNKGLFNSLDTKRAIQMTKLEQLKAARDAAWAAEATAYATARGAAYADAEATWAAYVVAYAESDAAVTAWVAELKKTQNLK